MSNAFVTIKMCYVYNPWNDISCATLYFKFHHIDTVPLIMAKMTQVLHVTCLYKFKNTSNVPQIKSQNCLLCASIVCNRGNCHTMGYVSFEMISCN